MRLSPFNYERTHLLLHVSKQSTNLGCQMNNMRRLELFKYLIRIPPTSQIPVLTTEEDPRFIGFGVGVRVRFDGLADQAWAPGYENYGAWVSFGVVFCHVVCFITTAECVVERLWLWSCGLRVAVDRWDLTDDRSIYWRSLWSLKSHHKSTSR